MLSLATLAPTWGGQELRYAQFGDQRLKARAVALLLALAAHPDGSLPAALREPAALQGAYRFLAHAAVTPAALRTAHRARTLDRLRPLPRVLFLQDTTELDYTTQPATTGLGPLACATHHGLLVHTTLALTETGSPLGIVDQQVWARDPAATGQAAHRRQRPLAAKESRRWGEALQASHRDLSPALETVTIADREADLYALFATPRPPRAHLLIRGAHNRTVTADAPDAPYLWDAIRRAAPLPSPLTVAVPRGHAGVARTATLTLRVTTVTLHAPHRGPGRVDAIRLVPEQPATTVFTRDELAVACAAVERRRLADDDTPSLATAVRWIAQLGGFQGRPSGGPPGPKTLWRGMGRLDALVEGTRLAVLLGPSPGNPHLGAMRSLKWEG